MLALSFFAAIFSSLLWLIYSLAYISDNTIGIKLSSLGVTDLSIYVLLVMLPIFIVWMIFGYITQYFTCKTTHNSLITLFKQLKKNQDYTDLIARIMLESEQQIKDGFILNRIDILIADMNELIAGIIARASLASKEQVESLWSKVNNGAKWAFGKVIIEISQNQPNFQMRIFQKSQNDIVLAGSVLEFCARYQNILSLLDKHDKERVFLNVIETGIFGKVYSILAPVADEVRRHRDVTPKAKPETVFEEEITARAEDRSVPMRQTSIPTSAPASAPEPEKKSVLSKINLFRKKEPHGQSANPHNRDPFSIALERSFGNNEEPHSPVLSAEIDDEVVFSSPEISVNREEEDNTPKFSYAEEDNNPADLIIHYEEEHIATETPQFQNREEPKLSAEQRIPDFMFRSEQEVHENEPRFDIKVPEQLQRHEPILEQEVMTNTQKTLNELKKEWEDMRKAPQVSAPNSKKTEESEDLAYPFGGWTDESNYHK